LGSLVNLVATTTGLVVTAPNIAVGSLDGGKSWTTVVPPAHGAGIAMDATNPLRAITGGSAVQITNDGGRSWLPTVTAPPGRAPYRVLLISPFDGKVWFLVDQGKLLRTRDGSITWRELPSLPVLIAPVMVPGHVVGEFFLASSHRIFDLIDNGQRIVEQPPLLTNVAQLAAVGGAGAALIARSTNNGLFLLRGGAWSALNGVDGGPIAAGASSTLLVGNGSAELGSPGAVAYSVDLGTAWSQGQGLPYDQTVEAIAGQPTSTTFFAYCYGGDLYVSSDGGATWAVLTRALRRSTG
jgi:hypothetical protein